MGMGRKGKPEWWSLKPDGRELPSVEPISLDKAERLFRTHRGAKPPYFTVVTDMSAPDLWVVVKREEIVLSPSLLRTPPWLEVVSFEEGFMKAAFDYGTAVYFVNRFSHGDKVGVAHTDGRVVPTKRKATPKKAKSRSRKVSKRRRARGLPRVPSRAQTPEPLHPLFRASQADPVAKTSRTPTDINHWWTGE